MAITNYSAQRIGQTVLVTVVSDLSGDDIYYHWYLDGAWLGYTRNEPTFAVYLPPSDTAEIVCQDTADADYDGIANAPDGNPSRMSLYFLRALDSDVDYYRVDHATGQSTPGSGDWSEIGRVAHTGEWAYSFLSPVLDDLTWHWFRVVPVDAAGNEGDALTFGPYYHVRRPDGPTFSASYDSGTQRITFAAA